MSSSSIGVNHEVEIARKRLQAASSQVVSTTTNLQMQHQQIYKCNKKIWICKSYC